MKAAIDLLVSYKKVIFVGYYNLEYGKNHRVRA
jgi:hypothetical protein